MTREEAIKALNEYGTLFPSDKSEAIDMAIEALKGAEINCVHCPRYFETEDETGVHSHCEDLISRETAIKTLVAHYTKKLMEFGYKSYAEADTLEKMYCDGVADAMNIVDTLPAIDRPSDEEDQLKFYYVESIDDYWIGMRIDNFYYADWHEGLGFVWSKSRYLPWGEHITDKTTLWKEHTYPSEPVEMPFTDWIVGFVKKYFADRPKGEWIESREQNILMAKRIEKGETWRVCSNCGTGFMIGAKYEGQKLYGRRFHNFCPRCGADMRGGDE